MADITYILCYTNNVIVNPQLPQIYLFSQNPTLNEYIFPFPF